LEAEATARTAHVRLNVDIPEHDSLAVLGRHEDLSRAISNLVSNAIRHTEPDQTVQVSADRAEDGSVRVLVMDGCGGIPEAYLDRVFDTGWRGSPARGSTNGGAGLGLAIARGVVESHQGEIAVRNTETGCCFEVALPQARQSVRP
jgi:signal transduction histidine kinase